jgi:hypothetical protein
MEVSCPEYKVVDVGSSQINYLLVLSMCVTIPPLEDSILCYSEPSLLSPSKHLSGTTSQQSKKMSSTVGQQAPVSSRAAHLELPWHNSSMSPGQCPIVNRGATLAGQASGCARSVLLTLPQIYGRRLGRAHKGRLGCVFGATVE